MKSTIPNLFINNCKDNIEYYQTIFGGEIQNIVSKRDEPDKIMHSELHINENCVLYFGDKYEPTNPNFNYHVFLKLDSEAEINKIYSYLKVESQIIVELQKSFWGTLHAVLTDKNGITWDLDY